MFTQAGVLRADQLAAFETAASYWESKLTDNVTVYVRIGFADLGSNILGSATTAESSISYSQVRSLLTADRTSATDFSAVSHLQAGSSLSFIATQPNQTTRLDNDGSTNNRQLVLTTANAKALGYTNTATDASSPDATIQFSTGFDSRFAYSRVNGQVPGNQIDFITVAEHELGHALGFVSGVDNIDYCLDNAAQCGTQAGFENRSWYSTLDLFRYSAAGTLNVSVISAAAPKPYFSVDGGVTAIETFSTGDYHGDGNQASHFGGNVAALMRPTVSFGASYDASSADLLAMDAIGWNLATAVPEPASYALLLSGLTVLGWARRRRS